MAEIPLDRLSLVVGVTGHRDISPDDEAPLRAAFGRTLESLAERCPHTPLLVLSGLAAGADSIAAEEAVARGIPIIACLPMPIEDYEKDFTPDGVIRFRELLAASAREVITSPVRENGYVAAGRFIARYSHLLVAFYDGLPSRGAGGTADVIEMRMTGRAASTDVEGIPYLPDVGPVELVTTPRANAARPSDAYAVKREYPKRYAHDRDEAAAFDSILSHIDAYNEDLDQTPSLRVEPPLADLMERTDAAANRLQKRTWGFQWLLLVIAFIAAAVQIIGHIPPLAKVLAFGAAFVAYRAARKHDFENRYQDYRAVAEGLRVQYAWFCAGLSDRLVDNEYLRMQEGELQWIRMALRYFYLVYCEGYAHAEPSFENPVCRDWIRSQWRYYYRASRREIKRKELFDRVTMLSIAIGIVCSVVSAFVLWDRLPCALFSAFCSPAFHPNLGFEILQNLLTVPIALATVVGAVLTHVEEKENFVGSARRYERMFHVFDRARRDLAAIAKGRPGDTGEILYELGRAALIEHADWLIMRRDRPMKVVVV